MKTIISNIRSLLLFKYKSVTIILLLTIFVGIITRFVFIPFYTEFSFDQARDAEIYMQIPDGQFPAYGPTAGGFEFAVPPLYYYIMSLTTIFSHNPVWELLPMAFFSFAGIFLLMRFIYLILDKVDTGKRILLSVLGGFWWSFFTFDILTTNTAWNPNLAFACVMIFFISIIEISKTASVRKLIIYWTILGIVSSIMMDLHTSLMLIVPILLIIFTIYFVKFNNTNTRYNLLYPFFCIILILILHIPYFHSELANGWTNTKLLFGTIFGSMPSPEGTNILEIVGNFIRISLQVVERHYFQSFLSFFSIIFLLVIAITSLKVFKGNKVVWIIMWAMLILNTLILTFHPYRIQNHYFFSVQFIPLVLAIVSLAYLNEEILVQRLIFIFIISALFTSFLINVYGTYNFMARKIKIINTNDIANILNSLPDNSSICYEGLLHYEAPDSNNFEYIDKYVVHKEHNFKINCMVGDYFIFSKFISIPGGQFQIDQKDLPNESHYRLVSENYRYSIYEVI